MTAELNKNKNSKSIKRSLQMLNSAITNLSRMKMEYCKTRGVMRDIDQVISQLNIIKEIITYKHRLPLYDIEQAIIALFKQDPSLHGVQITIYFPSKYGVIDKSRLGYRVFNL